MKDLEKCVNSFFGYLDSILPGKRYRASYVDKRGDCWDLVIEARNYEDARKDARRAQREYGKLWSLRMVR